MKSLSIAREIFKKPLMGIGLAGYQAIYLKSVIPLHLVFMAKIWRISETCDDFGSSDDSPGVVGLGPYGLYVLTAKGDS